MSAPTNGSISHEELLRLVRYDPETGKFWPIIGRRGAPLSKPLGHVEKNGYRRIMINGARVLAHRLAWFYMTGEWPEIDIDHKNRHRDENWWDNLRLATDSQNHQNIPGGTGISGLKGAHWNRFRNHWQSYIRADGKSTWVGRFETAEEAHIAYCAAAEKLHGEFMRVG